MLFWQTRQSARPSCARRTASWSAMGRRSGWRRGSGPRPALRAFRQGGLDLERALGALLVQRPRKLRPGRTEANSICWRGLPALSRQPCFLCYYNMHIHTPRFPNCGASLIRSRPNPQTHIFVCTACARFSSLFIHAGFSPAADVKNLVLGEAGHFHLALDDHFWRAPKFHVNPFL